MSNPDVSQSRLATPFIRKANRLALISLLAFLLGAALFLASSTQANLKSGTGSVLKSERPIASNVNSPNPVSRLEKWNEPIGTPKLFSFLLPQSPPAPETIVTYAADCTTPKNSFIFGEIACAILSGGPPLSIYPRKITWVDTDNNILQKEDVTTDPQTSLFTIPVVSISTDYRGVWRVNDISAARSSVRTSAFIYVSNPALPAADLSVYKGNDTDGSITAGSNIEYVLWLSNKGPDAASNVQVTDATPANATFLSGNTDDPDLHCTFPAANSSGGTTTCTRTSLDPGASDKVTLVFNVSGGTQAGTTISNTASISSDTADPHDASNTPPSNNPADNGDSSNNSQTSRTQVVAGAAGPTCTLQCPDNITANANTTENNQRGAHVTYNAPDAAGGCGSVSSTPASGSFFPVGTTVVNATSETGGGSCSFTVTVQDTTENPPTISCPPNKEANANSDCEAVVNLGNPTASGDNVTITVTRSDGKPMYDCDANGNNCTRKNPDLPFPAGATTVTWTATSHDSQGNDTGNASCQQTVTVDDVTPPTINAPPQTASADANCQAPVPDYSNSASDNCACSSSDTSESCQDRERITVTQNPAAGTLVGPGTYTITLTANDGSSNNNGAGNTTTTTTTFTVNDTTAPTIHCPADITVNTEPGTCSAHVIPGTATATDNCDSNPTITGTRSDGKPLTDPYPGGITTITWTATDHANPPNQSSCTQTITVEDHENPTIVCPLPIVQGTDPGTCSATVNPGQPTSTDNCGSPIVTGTRSDSQPLNAPYPKGTTTITWTATDASGNSASCTQTVTVNDTEAPTITTNGVTPVLWPANHAYHTFNVTDFVTGVSDNCDTLSVSNVVIALVTSDEVENGPGSGNTFNDIVIAADCKSVQLRAERENSADGRVYTITFKVTDSAGNVGTKTSKVHVPKNMGVPVVDSGPHYAVAGTCP